MKLASSIAVVAAVVLTALLTSCAETTAPAGQSANYGSAARTTSPTYGSFGSSTMGVTNR